MDAQIMASAALHLPNARPPRSAALVLGLGHRFEMVRSNAVPAPALVIEAQPVENGPDEREVDGAVRLRRAAALP